MKRIFLALMLLAASWQVAVAQSVTKVAFTAKVNQMDSYIGSGDMTNANATFNDIQAMMKAALHDSKMSVSGATTDADRSAYMAVDQNQGVLFNKVWKLKNDLATNRADIHARLGEFENTLH